MTVESVGRAPAAGGRAAWLRRTVLSPLRRRQVRVALGLAVLAFLAWRLGSGPFVSGVRATTAWAVLAALVLTAGTTWCVALRWSLVSGRFGPRVPLRTAYAAYYRSQLVNATVPGGVVGDVDRGVRHGWRGVLADRVVGQVVQVALVGSVLLPGPWRWAGLAVVGLAAAAGGAVLLLSALAVAGHLLVFLAAAESAGVALPLGTLVTVGAVVLLGAAIPLNVAGWGPREGVAAWAFAAFGSTAATGLAVSVTFGVLATIATLPGLATLVPSPRRLHG